MVNPLLETSNPRLKDETFKDNLGRLKELYKSKLIHEAEVLDTDRYGGRFVVNRGGNGGQNSVVSVHGTLKVRLLTNLYNESDASQDAALDMDEYYVLPLSHNRIQYPGRGEIVQVMFDRPFERGANVIGYWTSKRSHFGTKDYETNWKYRPASHGKDVTHNDASIHSGETPATVGKDYDIMPEHRYEPYPEVFRDKEGDIADRGSSNTTIKHSFNAHVEGEKRGYLELATELDYIENHHNDEDGYAPFEDTSFDFDTASKEQIETYQKMRINHIKKYLDADMQKSRWEFLNSKGSRVIIGTKINVDARLIHKDYEKDGTGKFGNVQLKYDKNYRDEGKGERCGEEIEAAKIHESFEFQTTHGDVVQVEADAREPITFDEAVPTVLVESEQIRLATRGGKDMNHAVLGEVQGRFLMKLLMLILHCIRTMDILNDRIHRLGKDFVSHSHAVVPSKTMAPLGSPENPTGAFIKEFPYYIGTTEGSVGGDSSFEEKGSDSSGMKIKDRIKDERALAEALIKAIPEQHSKSIALN